MLHPTEKYYPLRPELAESTFYLYQATKGASLYCKFTFYQALLKLTRMNDLTS